MMGLIVHMQRGLSTMSGVNGVAVVESLLTAAISIASYMANSYI